MVEDGRSSGALNAGRGYDHLYNKSPSNPQKN